MVNYNLRIGKHKARYTPLAVKMPALKDVDEKGNTVRKVQKVKGEWAWVNDADNTPVEKVYKSLNGKVIRKMEKTTEVEDFKKITKIRALSLNREMTYLVFCDSLASELKDNEALEFYFTNGNGFRVYQTVIYKEDGFLFMACGLGYLTDLAKKIDAFTEKDQTETVSRATMKDMLSALAQ